MAEVVYRPEIRIERLPGSLRKAQLPSENTPTFFGTHGAIAKHYGRAPGTYEPHATTIDHVIAATGGWLLGTFGGALEARQIPATGDRLTAVVTGEVELEEKVLVLKRIHARMELRVSPEQREAADRIHGVYANACPLYRSLRAAIAITSELVLLPA